VRNLVILRGGMNSAERQAAEIALKVAEDQERLVLARIIHEELAGADQAVEIV
jgi:hypothetical protein